MTILPSKYKIQPGNPNTIYDIVCVPVYFIICLQYKQTRTFIRILYNVQSYKYTFVQSFELKGADAK